MRFSWAVVRLARRLPRGNRMGAICLDTAAVGVGAKARGGPGGAHREGISVIEAFPTFPANAATERWFEQQRWPEGWSCPRCGSTRRSAVPSRKPMPCHCRDCRRHASVRFGAAERSGRAPGRVNIAHEVEVTLVRRAR